MYLKNGMIVETRNKTKYIVMDDRIVNLKGWIPLDSYNYYLIYEDNSEWDIMKIYDYQEFYGMFCLDIDKLIKHMLCVYDREEFND